MYTIELPEDIQIQVRNTTDFTISVGLVASIANFANGFVPYTGATGNLDLGGFSVLNYEKTPQLNTRDTNNRNRANHTGTQLANTISDFQTTVSANSNVTANTAKVTNATHTGEVTGATTLTLDKTAITNKPSATVASGDLVLIADINDSNNLKQVTAQSIADLGVLVVSDGDKGDITVSGGGNTWNINNSTVGISKLSATGTPSSSTYLRGDNTWGTPPGGGGGITNEESIINALIFG